MGATTFMTTARGSNAREAFGNAVNDARHEHGHGGYTGTIAEKHDFTEIDVGTPPPDVDARKWRAQQAGRLLDGNDPRVSDKWGPAGCTPLGGNEYLFFGWASE